MCEEHSSYLSVCLTGGFQSPLLSSGQTILVYIKSFTLRQDITVLLVLPALWPIVCSCICQWACGTGTEMDSQRQSRSGCSECVVWCVSALDELPVHSVALFQNTDYSLSVFPCDSPYNATKSSSPAPCFKSWNSGIWGGPCSNRTCKTLPYTLPFLSQSPFHYRLFKNLGQLVKQQF